MVGPATQATAIERRLDVALLVPGWSDRDEWSGRSHLYVHQRPKATAAGARVWLCQNRMLFYSYRLDGFIDLSHALPTVDGREDEGWALQVSDGRSSQRPLSDIRDPTAVAARWSHGIRYLSPGGRRFVRASGRAVRTSGKAA